MRKFAVVGSVFLALALGGCGDAVTGDREPPSGNGSAGTVEALPEETPAEEAPAEVVPPAAPETETSAGGGAAGQWPMPDLVGSVLQEAQDRMQALTGGAVFHTTSHDLSGNDRNQVLDANWQVCTQNVPPGTALTAGSRIDFGVVKVDEGCP